MDFPSSQMPPARLPWGRGAAALAILGLALYAVLLSRNVGAVAGGSDSSGYMNQARLLGSGSVHVQPRTIPGLPFAAMPPYFYVPLGFRPAPDGNGMVPTYPTGFSLFVLALRPLAGWRYAGDAAAILNSLGGLVATYALGRILGLGRRWSALGAAIVAASPLYLLMSLMAMSDVPSLLWTTLAVLAALKCRERPSWALAAGAALAVAILLRPTNILAFIPVGVALGASFRRWILLALGGLPGAVFLGAYTLAAYGSIAATGYGDTTDSFAARYVPTTLMHGALWLPALFTPVAALFLGIPWLGSLPARTRWLLAAWVLPFAAFYSAYRFTHETWWYLRFLLPVIPAIVVGSLLVLQSLSARVSGRGAHDLGPVALTASLVLVAGCSEGLSHYLHPLYVGRMEHQYERITDWMERNLPPDSVCVAMQASGALFYYTHFTFIRWDFIGQGNLGKVEAAIRGSKRPLYAVLFPAEYNGAHVLETKMPGHWSQVGMVGDVMIVRRDFEPQKS
jgi:hypothetical protein